MRRSAPEEAKSGFPFLVLIAGFVLAVGVGAVWRFCPQDLRIEGGKTRTAKPSTTTMTVSTPPIVPASTAPVIAPTTFTTVGDPSPATTTAAITTATTPSTPTPAAMPAPVSPNKKRVSHRLPASRGSTASPATSASASPNAEPPIPENPYAAPANPETYGF